jgi:hypothetical protein
VRCYEARVGRFGPSLPVRCLADYTQTLWTAPAASSSSARAPDLGDFEACFKITLPVNAAGHSTVTFPDYKVYWRVEAGRSSCSYLQGRQA